MSGQPQRARGRGGRGQPRPQGEGEAPRQWGPSRGGRGGPRPGPPQQTGAAWGPTPGGSQQQQQQPAQTPAWGPAAGAWGPRPAQPQQHQAGFGGPPKDVPPQRAVGRAVHRGAGEEMQPGEQQIAMEVGGGGEGGNMGMVKRGGIRGRREIKAVDIVRTRPSTIVTKQATDGMKIPLVANFFNLEKTPNWTLYQYRVDFAPEVDSTKARMGMMRTALRQVMPAHIFDGTILYCSRRFNPEPYEAFVQSNKGENIRITLRLRQDVVAFDALNIQIFNLIIRNCLRHLKLQLVKRNYFDAAAAQQVGNFNFEVWPGYETSIRQYERSIMMNVEIINKCMRVETALDFLNQCLANDRGNYQDNFAREIIGSVVLTGYNNKTYMIDDVEWGANPTRSFRRKDGSEITYLTYFKERYNLNIRDTRQPLLISRSKAREIRAGMPETVCLIPELCRMTGLTNSQRSNYQFMAALAQHTRIGPPDRIRKLMEFKKRLCSHPDIINELRQWDIQLADNLINFEGRQLNREKIIYQSATIPTADDASWTRDMQRQCMLSKAPLSDDKGGWCVMCTKNDFRDVSGFIENIMKAAKGMGWNISRPFDIIQTQDDRTGTLLSTLDQIITKKKPQLIFNALGGNKPDRYNAIKKKCYVDNCVPNQVVLLRTMRGKAAMSAATKIVIQMNCKLGGAPWAVSFPPKDTIYIGFDVCHDPKDRTKNYGAMVATLDQHCTRYFSSVQSHSKGEEISNYFGFCVGQGVKQWMRSNNSLPARIVIFRDGVGDGQIPFLLDHEIKHMQTVLKQMFNYEPKIGFNVVGKRISTRFVSYDRRTNQYSNPPPGTVVDDVITLPERYDFFLVSQCVRQGTVTPTSYNVIYDNTGFSVSHMQQLTQKLTHMYFNWSGTIRVPAVCQYAHKLAFLTSQNLQRAPNPEMANTLYYL